MIRSLGDIRIRFETSLSDLAELTFVHGREQIPQIVAALSINFSSVAHTGYDYLMSLRVNSIDDSIITVANPIRFIGSR